VAGADVGVLLDAPLLVGSAIATPGGGFNGSGGYGALK
jgi:hypothetical protein